MICFNCIDMFMFLYAMLAGFLAFGIVYAVLPKWIKNAEEIGFVGRDMNKPGKPEVAEGGGVWVSVSVAFGLLFFLALNVYLLNTYKYAVDIMALSLLLFLASFLGFLDDILGWKKGLRAIYRIILMAPLAIPMIVIKAGYSTMSIPFIGIVNFGILYPLVIVPIGILGAANAFNMIAGYNGLEASLGLQLMIFTGIYTAMNNVHPSLEASIIMSLALIGFLAYNWYPARVFPGNSFTYGFGAYYASLVIIGNFEKFGLLLFTLYFVELILFLRGLKDGVYKENYAQIVEGDYLELPYRKIYSTTHMAIWIQKKLLGKASEKGVVLTLNIIQAIIGIVCLFIIKFI